MGDTSPTTTPPSPPTDAPRAGTSRSRIVSDENDAGHLRFLRSPLRPRSGGAAASAKRGIQLADSPSPKPAAARGSDATNASDDDHAAAPSPNRGCAELRAALDGVAAALAAGGGRSPAGGGGVRAEDDVRHAPAAPATHNAASAADVVPDSVGVSPVKQAVADAPEAATTPLPAPAPATTTTPPSPADGPMDPADAEARFLGDYMAAVLTGDGAAASLARATPTTLAAGLSDGALLCRLLAATCPAAGVDERAINVPGTGGGGGHALSREEALQNVALALDAARAAGAALPPSLTPPLLVDADTPAPALDAAWAVAWLALSAPLSVAARPAALAVLRAPGEDAARFVAAPPTTLLLRWVNHHLGACGAAWGRPPVEDLAGDLVDSAAYAALAAALRRARVTAAGQEAGALEAALPTPPSLDCLPPLRRLQAGFDSLDARRADLAARAAAVHPSLAALAPPARPLPPPAALAAGSPRVGAATLATLFAAGDALDGAAAADAADVARALEGGGERESRDDRTLRVWVASIVGVPPSAPELLAALREGHLLLRALDALSPGCVDWRRAHTPPFKPLLARPRSIENANQAIEVARRLSGLPLVNVSGEDIVNGERKQAAAVLWQLQRLHLRKLLADATGAVAGNGSTPPPASPGRAASTTRAADAALDAEVLAWANARAASAGGRRRAASLGDRSLATGLFLLDLLAAVSPASVNPALVSPGRTAREKECNARYAIAAARKLGVSLPLLPEDLADASPRAALIFMAALLLYDKKKGGGVGG